MPLSYSESCEKLAEIVLKSSGVLLTILFELETTNAAIRV